MEYAADMFTLVALIACNAGKVEVSADETANDTQDSGAPCVPSDEICDGIDNDCDGLHDDADPDVQGTTVWSADRDGDSFGDPASLLESCSAPDGFVADYSDCDDADAEINPAASEVCDTVDNDCDELVDDADDTLEDDRVWYSDVDADGFGGEPTAEVACDAPAGTVEDGSDCDDADPAVNPNAVETCDELDDDCDGLVDAEDGDLFGAPVWYADDDGDGYGAAPTDDLACTAPAGKSATNDDCNDTGPAVNPGAAEVCNDIDDDCDTDIDDRDASLTGAPTWYYDRDEDGYGDSSTATVACVVSAVPAVLDATDCNDSSAASNPAAVEVCDDDDNDCDGLVDGHDDSLSDPLTWYMDADHDGYGDPASFELACNPPIGTVADNTDCNDASALANPGVVEERDACYDTFDNDCDGLTDGEDGCEICTNEVDDDGDGDADCDDSDCNLYAPYWYQDGDSDGFGRADIYLRVCVAPSGYVADSTDCIDSNAAANPAATEVCDGLDNDCDGLTDGQDDSVVDASTWYPDADGDGYGDSFAPEPGCHAPSGTVADGNDCDDGDASIHPGATEVCDGIDDDCDGIANGATTWYRDGDLDGSGDVQSPALDCTQPPGHVANALDCDDEDANLSADNAEICDDGLDNDCDCATDLEDDDCTSEDCSDGTDDDADGFVDCDDPDCAGAWDCVAVGSDYTTAFGEQMITVTAGTFTMGSGNADPDDTWVDHEVTLTRHFWIGRSEVTQAQWAAWSAATDPDPSAHTYCDTFPVESISWHDAAMYANALSAAEGLSPCYLADGTELDAAYADDPYSCPGYRFPTEAEWEYAARAGEDTAFAGSDDLDAVAWHYGNVGTSTRVVCGLQPNAWALCDMTGNVWEMTNDWGDYDSSYGGYVDGSPSTDPTGQVHRSTSRLVRGGAWESHPEKEYLAYHVEETVDYAGYSYTGFRLARTVP